MTKILDRDVCKSEWSRYLKKYFDKYLLVRDELGIWSLRLKENLGFIQPYSLVNKRLVAVMTFRSKQHKTFFKKRLIENRGFELKITQEGDNELCIVFDEKNLNDVETLFKIRKKYKLTKKEREKRVERMKLARSAKNGDG